MLQNRYLYENVSADRTTTLVQTVETAAGTYTYTYDKLGNITAISDGTYTTSYVYDALNQLVRSNDEKAGKTYTYAYQNGNITEKKEYAYTTGALGEVLHTTTWRYDDNSWGDLLTSWNGKPITYDAIGNPLTIGSSTLSWQGRQLQSITDGANTYAYRYNIDGQRLAKTVNGVTTEYFYNGNILAGEKTEDNTLVFLYDNNGDAFGFTYNGTAYFYVKNAQNDVVAIADAAGAVIARYSYDDWGGITAVTDANGVEITDKTQIAHRNPLRYRSYYYDSETGFYHLQTRYYVPEFSRFLNVDWAVGINQDIHEYNLLAYCSNDPINNSDANGQGRIRDWFHSTTAKVGAWMTEQKTKVDRWFNSKSSYNGPVIPASSDIASDLITLSENIVYAATKKAANKGKSLNSPAKKTPKTGMAGDIMSAVSFGLDIGNTCTAKNNNLNWQRVEKVVIQVTAFAAEVLVGALSASVTAALSGGSGGLLTVVGLTAGMAVNTVGVSCIDYVENWAYRKMGIE